MTLWSFQFDNYGPFNLTIMVLSIWQLWSFQFDNYDPLNLTIMVLSIWQLWSFQFDNYDPFNLTIMVLSIWQLWSFQFDNYDPSIWQLWSFQFDNYGPFNLTIMILSIWQVWSFAQMCIVFPIKAIFQIRFSWKLNSVISRWYVTTWNTRQFDYRVHHHVTALPPAVTPRNNPSFGFEGCRIAAAGYHNSLNTCTITSNHHYTLNQKIVRTCIVQVLFQVCFHC